VEVPAGEAAVVDDGLVVVDAAVDDGLDVLRTPPGDAVVEVVVDGVWVGVPDVGRVVSAMKSSANPTGKTSRKPCVKNNRDHSRFHRRWTGKPAPCCFCPARINRCKPQDSAVAKRPPARYPASSHAASPEIRARFAPAILLFALECRVLAVRVALADGLGAFQFALLGI